MLYNSLILRTMFSSPLGPIQLLYGRLGQSGIKFWLLVKLPKYNKKQG